MCIRDRDETVTEIMVNGPDAIFVERAGKLTKWDKTFTSGEKLEEMCIRDRLKHSLHMAAV